MFGCCVAGRLLQTNLTQIDSTHAYFELPNASSINHICVFLLGTVPFPQGYAASVHFFWPGKGFQLLGMLSNEKPSAIFRLRGGSGGGPAGFTPTPSGTSTPTIAQSTFSAIGNAASGAFDGQQQDVTAILGLAIEPIDQIQSQLQAQAQALKSTPGALVLRPDASEASASPLVRDPALLADRIVRHLFTYLSSFIPGGNVTSLLNSPDVSVPLGVIARWYESFMTKLRAGGIGFLERMEE